MPAIVTVTFNPVIDKSTSVPLLIAEKKLQCEIPVYEPGGGINVARAIKKLGGEATAIYLAGGYNGTRFTQLLVGESIESIVTVTKESTRENLTLLETSSNQQYRFGMPGPEISEPEWRQCLKNIEKTTDVEYIVASGSVPPGIPTDIFAMVSFISKKKMHGLLLIRRATP